MSTERAARAAAEISAIVDQANDEIRRAWTAFTAGLALDDLYTESTEPRTWSLPPEPGPEVTRLRCECHDAYWHLVYAPPAGAWMPETADPMRVPESEFKSWLGLLIDHRDITDASPTPPLTAALTGAPEDAGDAPPASPA
jgi:hypothetical protein